MKAPFTENSTFLTPISTKCSLSDAKEYFESICTKTKEILDDLGINE